MKRGKKLVLISHCIINQNSVVFPLGRAFGAFKFVSLLLEEGIGIIQLPCPELKHLGIRREPMDKASYDTPEYRALCSSLTIPIVAELKQYIENGYNLCGLIGIGQSPTCSINNERGIFMEELFNTLIHEELIINYIDVPEDYVDELQYWDFFQCIKKAFHSFE